MGSRYVNYAVKIDTPTVANKVLGTIRNLSHVLNSQVIEPDTGDPYSVAKYFGSQSPEVPFATNAIKTVLDNIGLTGLCITDDATHVGFAFFKQKLDPCGVNGRASSNHMSVTFAKGHVFIEQISAARGGEAEMTLRFHGLSEDDLTQPQVIAYNATLPATKVDNEHYALGKAKILGSTVDKITNLTVAYNPVFQKAMAADCLWPGEIILQRINALTTITTEDPEWLENDVPLEGAYAEHDGETEIWLLARDVDSTPASGGGFQDFASALHISATLSGLIHVTTHVDGSGNATGQTTIQIESTYDGTNAPIIWDTTTIYDL